MMLKGIFGTRKTNKLDVVVAIGGAIFAVIGAISTTQQYKTDNESDDTQENEA